MYISDRSGVGILFDKELLTRERLSIMRSSEKKLVENLQAPVTRLRVTFANRLSR